MQNKLLAFGLSIGVVIALILGGVALNKPSNQITYTAPDGTKTQVGAATGPDLPFSYLSVGGIRREYRVSTALTAATTTPCALQSPAATSTLAYEAFSINVGTSTTGLITVATSTTAFATTSRVTEFSVASGQQFYHAHSATTTSSGETITIGPSTYLVYGVAGVPYGFTYTGSCQAEFIVTSYQ